MTGRAYMKVKLGELRRTMLLLFKPSKVIAIQLFIINTKKGKTLAVNQTGLPDRHGVDLDE